MTFREITGGGKKNRTAKSEYLYVIRDAVQLKVSLVYCSNNQLN